jgi:hypothetical protein
MANIDTLTAGTVFGACEQRLVLRAFTGTGDHAAGTQNDCGFSLQHLTVWLTLLRALIRGADQGAGTLLRAFIIIPYRLPESLLRALTTTIKKGTGTLARFSQYKT